MGLCVVGKECLHLKLAKLLIKRGLSPQDFRDAYTVVDIKDCTHALLWSKTTRTTGCVGGTWEDPPTCKMGTFFLMSLTLTEPILSNIQ